jgi:hypothetical protein
MSMDEVIESEPVEERSEITQALVASSQALATIDASSAAAPGALAAQAVAQVQSRYIMAMRNPRAWPRVEEELLSECKSARFAEAARYIKPIGGKGIEGLSIRFVEAAIRAMGNILVQTMVVHDDAERRIVKVSVTDLEKNAYYDTEMTVRKTVERSKVKEGQRVLSSRINSAGRTVHLVEATEDEMEVKSGAMLSKSIRTLTLRLIPQFLKEKCEEQIVETLKAEATKRPDMTTMRMVKAFAALGVDEAGLQKYVGRDALGVLSPDELVELRAVYNTLADGQAAWSEMLLAKTGEVTQEVEGTKGSRAEEVKKMVRDRAQAQGRKE